MSNSTAKVSPFTQTVVGAVKRLYPEALADKSFDNTGLLLEAPLRPGHLRNSALLTIDLTKAVADEAIARRDSIIIAYHPIIFRPLKSFTLANSQQNSLLRLAQEGISVYSPHTAVDAAPGGLNDWLADIITGQFYRSVYGNPPRRAFSKTRVLLTPASPSVQPSPHDRSLITPIQQAPQGFEKAGYGRIVRFLSPQPLGLLVSRVTQGLGDLSGLSVAVPQSVPAGQKYNIQISSVGICAGSGGSMLNGLDVDLLFTGELSHHEALAAIEQGKCVITAFHSNTEREFLKSRMRPALINELEKMVEEKEINEMVDREKWGLVGGFDIAVSEADRDPYEIITSGQTGW